MSHAFGRLASCTAQVEETARLLAANVTNHEGLSLAPAPTDRTSDAVSPRNHGQQEAARDPSTSTRSSCPASHSRGSTRRHSPDARTNCGALCSGGLLVCCCLSQFDSLVCFGFVLSTCGVAATQTPLHQDERGWTSTFVRQRHGEQLGEGRMKRGAREPGLPSPVYSCVCAQLATCTLVSVK